MISQDDRAKIIELGKRYQASRILLFGSSASPGKEGRDIDLAVDGVPPSLFFEFYGRLIFSLSKPVDLVDLRRSSKFTEIILKEGIPLYG